ncbi:MAG TPA: hypothetical protein VMH80_15230 [Bryobacteraceae bacterium]|nr:hypothetical protein [Bryobacteraceae bacterium]
MQPVEPQTHVEVAEAPASHSWIHKLGLLLFIIVCFEVGAFLVVFPWTQQWETNALGGLTPWLHDLWINSYFRGALTGLGLLNIYISLTEVFRLRRPPADRVPDRLKVSTL